MHESKINKKEQTAVIEVVNQTELDFINSGLDKLISHQQNKVKDPDAPVQEGERLKRYEKVKNSLKVGPIKFNVQQIQILENAANEGICIYEKNVTDNPNDETLKSFKGICRELHHCGRGSLSKQS